MEIHLALRGRRELRARQQQVAQRQRSAASRVVISAKPRSQEPSKRASARAMVSVAPSGLGIAAVGAGEDATAGREDRGRRVGDRFDDDVALHAVRAAEPPDDHEIAGVARGHAAVIP